MQAIYDYIFATLIFVVIFTFAAASMINIVSMPMRQMQSQQLEVRAQTVLGALLGCVGDPPDWGSNIDLDPNRDLRAIGLARSLRTDMIYDLDPDKLARLSDIGSGACVDKETLYRLLNLETTSSSTGYRFRLVLTPVLNISVTPFQYMGEYPSKFIVKVTTHEMAPVGNVNITATIMTIYYDMSGKTIFTTNETKSAITFWNGSAVLDYSDYIEGIEKKGPIKIIGTVIVIVGDFFGMQTMCIYQFSESLLKGISIGKYLIVENYVDGPVVQVVAEPSNSAEITFNDVVFYNISDITSLIKGKSPWITLHKNKSFYCFELNYMEPDIYCIALAARRWGYSDKVETLVLFPRIPRSGFTIGEDAVPTETRVVALRRVVFVEKMAFFADFYFWPMWFESTIPP